MERDISVINLAKGQKLVIACDSSGGIGPKEKDGIQTSGEIVGKFAVRVALLEVLAVRAQPIAVINTLSVEYDPTGKEIIKGIKSELATLDLETDKLLNGSTEENIPTLQTGLGITVIAVANEDDLRIASSKRGDILVAIGLPKVGREVLDDSAKIADLKDMQHLLELDYINDILAVGSKGIEYEAQLLARLNDLELDLSGDNRVDLKKSAGPATVLLVTLAEDRLKELEKEFIKPVNLLGRLS